MSRPRDDRQKDLLRPALDEIIDLRHPLVRLLVAAAYNFSLLLRWLAEFLRGWIAMLAILLVDPATA